MGRCFLSLDDAALGAEVAVIFLRELEQSGAELSWSQAVTTEKETAAAREQTDISDFFIQQNPDK